MAKEKIKFVTEFYYNEVTFSHFDQETMNTLYGLIKFAARTGEWAAVKQHVHETRMTVSLRECHHEDGKTTRETKESFRLNSNPG